jgi:hypothetical protein
MLPHNRTGGIVHQGFEFHEKAFSPLISPGISVPELSSADTRPPPFTIDLNVLPSLPFVSPALWNANLQPADFKPTITTCQYVNHYHFERYMQHYHFYPILEGMQVLDGNAGTYDIPIEENNGTFNSRRNVCADEGSTARGYSIAA